jgi:hypothetical protein
LPCVSCEVLKRKIYIKVQNTTWAIFGQRETTSSVALRGQFGLSSRIMANVSFKDKFEDGLEIFTNLCRTANNLLTSLFNLYWMSLRCGYSWMKATATLSHPHYSLHTRC